MGCSGIPKTQINRTSNKLNKSIISENYILAEFKIKEEHLEEKQPIYNAINNITHEGEDEKDVDRGIRECEIQINEKIIPFCQDYQFQKTGIYKIKYIFKNPLIDASSLFFYCPSLINIDLSHFQGQKLKIVREMFSGGCEFLEYINLSNFELPNVTDMRAMLSNCYSLKSIDFSNLKANKIENIAGLFGGCASLETINLSNFNTENVIDMSGLFYSCKTLKYVDLSNFNTKKVTNMQDMFNECNSLESIKLSNFDTINVTNMQQMFAYCSSLKELDLSNFRTQNVKNMEFMFTSCENLVKINLSNFNISKANIDGIFYECSKLEKGGIITKEKKILEQYETDLHAND